MAFRRGAVSYVSAILYMCESGLDRVGCNIMSLDRADAEYNPLSVDDDASTLRPRKQRQAFAKVSERWHILLLVKLLVGLEFGRTGVNHPADRSVISLSYDPGLAFSGSSMDM